MNDTKIQNVCKHCQQPIDFPGQLCPMGRINCVAEPASGDAPKVEETKYKLALKWIKMLWKYGEFTGACGSALREDGELKELLREADRIR